MTSQPSYPSTLDDLSPGHIPPLAEPDDAVSSDESLSWLEEAEPTDDHGSGGRAVLAWALALMAAGWIGLSAWSAGRAIGTDGIATPLVAQWVAVMAGPLALLGMLWLVFGRTRRRESEAFTRSVVAMRQESRSLEALLAVLRQRIDDNHLALRSMSNQLMTLGDEASERLGATTAEFGEGARLLALHGESLDRAAQSARVDIGVLLADLPRAETVAQSMAAQLRDAGASATEQAQQFEQQVTALTLRAQEADAASEVATGKLQAVLESLNILASSSNSTIDGLLQRTSEALQEVRSGIDEQALAVSALMEQSSVGIGRTGAVAAEGLRQSIGDAGGNLDAFAARIAEQEEKSRSLVREIDDGLSAVSERFQFFADQGDERATAIGATLALVRAELEAIGEQSGASDTILASLGIRADGLRATLTDLDRAIAGEIAEGLNATEAQADRLREATSAIQPALAGARDAAVEASQKLSQGADAIEAQHDRLAALLAAVDTGVGGAERRLQELTTAINGAEAEASRLSAETSPALVASLVQVKEAAAHAAERAREAIVGIIPQSAENLSLAARDALENAVREAVAEQMGEVERTAESAVMAARGASERLMQQMLSIGQSAAALEAHFAEEQSAQRERDSESFARRVALLIDSMHSASIDVGKILSDEVDERAWAAYQKGDRGIFTRRAVRLIGGNEGRDISAHYDSDIEFRDAVNRYVHDFETMMRRVGADRDGGPIAVALMSSDVGKLYGALAPLVGGKR
jgi:hypothetical protein